MSIRGPMSSGSATTGPFRTTVVAAAASAEIVSQNLLLADAAQADPSSILQSVAASGPNLIAVLEDPTTVSTLPNTGVRWSVPIKDVFGDIYSARPNDIVRLRLWLGDNGLPPDVIVGAALTTGAMSATAVGIGVTLQSGANNTRLIGYSTGSGVAWTNTAAAAGSTSTYGVDLQIGYITSATGQMRYQIHPVDSVGETFLLLNGSPAAAGSNGILGPWDTLTIWAGWRTGAGGSVGSTVIVSSELIVIPVAEIEGTERNTVSGTPGLPFTGAPPAQITILGLGNSHLQGASSGPEDPDWGSAGVQSGVTFRHCNNAGAVATNITTYGVRPGSVPYLAQKLLDFGVTEVNIVVNAGSGRSAQEILDNLNHAAAQVYSLGEGNRRPDCILYVQSAGNLATEQLYLDFTEDFPAVLDLLDILYPGVPVFVCSGIQQDDIEVPYWEEVDLFKQQIAAAGRCTYIDIFLDPSDLDGTDHPTVGTGEGVDIIADRIVAAWGVI